MTHPETGFKRETLTDDEGRYTIAGLPPAVYDVRASLTGFRTQEKFSVAVTVGETREINLTLDLGRMD